MTVHEGFPPHSPTLRSPPSTHSWRGLPPPLPLFRSLYAREGKRACPPANNRMQLSGKEARPRPFLASAAAWLQGREGWLRFPTPPFLLPPFFPLFFF